MNLNPLTIGFFSLGLIGVLASLPALVLSFSSKRWPSVFGKVLESGLDISSGTKISDHSVLPHLVFEYRVNNKKYTSSKIAILRGWTETEAKKYPLMYSVGSEVKVFYKPNKPRVAVIEPGVHMTAFLGLYISGVFMFMGGYWMFA